MPSDLLLGARRTLNRTRNGGQRCRRTLFAKHSVIPDLQNSAECQAKFLAVHQNAQGGKTQQSHFFAYNELSVCLPVCVWSGLVCLSLSVCFSLSASPHCT